MITIKVISNYGWCFFEREEMQSRLGKEKMTKFMTVVVAINDDEAFAEMRKEIFNSWRAFNLDENPPFGVCAISECNELARLEHINQGIDSLQDLIAKSFEEDVICEHYLSPQCLKDRSE